jgi:hypothetical protein
MKTKRLALFAATGVSVLVSSMTFAAGSGGNGSSATGTDTTMGPAAGSNTRADSGSKAGAGTSGPNAEGMSTDRMSRESTNTNGVNAGDRDKGSARAQDRAATQSGMGGVQPGQDEAHGGTSSTRHHRIGKMPKTGPEGSKTTPAESQ